jgi:HK97 family phage major capsid protein
MNASALREQKNSLMDKLHFLINTSKIEKRDLTGTEKNEFASIRKQVEAINRDLELDDMEHEQRMLNGKEIKGQSIEEKRDIDNFLKFVQTGETRDLAGANNGSMIPLVIAKQITDKVFEISPLIKEATVYYENNDMNLGVYDYSAHTTAFLQEFVDIVESSGTFSSIPLKSKIIGTMAKLGKSLVNRAEGVDILPFIVNACAKSVAKFLENEVVLNTNNKFASTLANGVTQNLQTATTLVIDLGEMVRLKNSIPSMMLPNAKWLMHKDTLSYLQSLKSTTGELLFGNSLSENNGNMILGHEVMLSDAMPKIGVNARQIYFGDFREGLAIKMGTQSAEVYRELYAKSYAYGIGHFLEVDVSASHSQQAISVMVGK